MTDGTLEEPRWLTDDEQRSWRAFLRANRLITVAMERALQKLGMSLPEYEILAVLSEAPGRRARMSELADVVTQSRSRLTHTASRLETRGWVRRVPFKGDKRGVQLCLTAEGLEHLVRASFVHVESVRECFIDLISPADFAQLGRTLGYVENELRARGITS